MKIRPLLLKLHLWVALATAIFLLILGVTGVIIVFTPTIERATHANLMTVTPAAARLPLDTLVAHVLPEGSPAVVIVPRDDDESVQIFLMNAKKKPTLAYVNQYSGAVLGVRTIAEQQKGFLLRTRTFHRNLLQGNNGSKVIGIVTILSVFMALSGLVLWWPRKIVTVKKGASLSRFNFDLHNIVGVFSSMLLLVLSLTGLMLSYSAVGKFVTNLGGPELPEPEYAAPQGQVPLSLDSLVTIATGTIAGSAPAAISLPRPKSAVINMGLRQPGEPANATRSRVWLDRFTGKVLRVDDSRSSTPGHNGPNLHLTIAMLHTGVLFGWITLTLVLLGAVGQVTLIVTGLLIWIKRTFRTRRTQPA